MAFYSFVPNRQPSEYMGGSGFGNWASGLGGALHGSMRLGIDLNNQLRNMQDMNALSPFARSAAMARLTSDRIGSLVTAQRGQGVLEGFADRQTTPENQMLGVQQPTSGAMASLGSPGQLSSAQVIDALARAFGEGAVAETSPAAQSGANTASSLLGLGRYQFNNPLSLSGWGL